MFNVASFSKLTAMNTLSAMGLGFLLAMLIFVDQNIVSSLTNAPENKYAALNVILMLSHLLDLFIWTKTSILNTNTRPYSTV